MPRIAISVVSALALLTTTIAADACSCVPYQSQAEADRAGEDVYRSAALIVEATVGDTSTAYRAMCPAAGARPRAADIGRTKTADRPITVHRVVKGNAPAAPILIGSETTVHAEGCAVTMNSCDVGIGSGVRTILILERAKDGRFSMMSYCSLVAFRQSKRGRALFGNR